MAITQRQENKAKLACLASEYQFRFCSQVLSIYLTLCLPRKRRQKCLLAPTNVTSDDTRKRQFGVVVFHGPRINPALAANRPQLLGVGLVWASLSDSRWG